MVALRTMSQWRRRPGNESIRRVAARGPHSGNLLHPGPAPSSIRSEWPRSISSIVGGIGFAYGSVGEHGLYFVAFSADPSRFDRMLAQMFGTARDKCRIG